MPSLIARGRREVSNARIIGSFVTPILRKKAQRLVQERVEDLRRQRLCAEPTSAPERNGPDAVAGTRSKVSESDPMAKAQDRAASNTAATTIPIEGYDQLPSSAIVELLDRLSPKECTVVADYEGRNRKRRTILTKARQLSAPVPRASRAST